MPCAAKHALRGRKLGFALVLTNCPANTRGNSGNNWRVRRTISRPFFFAAEAVSRARFARLAKNRRVEIGSLLRSCRRCAGVESDFRSLRFNDRSGGAGRCSKAASALPQGSRRTAPRRVALGTRFARYNREPSRAMSPRPRHDTARMANAACFAAVSGAQSRENEASCCAGARPDGVYAYAEKCACDEVVRLADERSEELSR